MAAPTVLTVGAQVNADRGLRTRRRWRRLSWERPKVSVEIIFPVSSESVTRPQPSLSLGQSLGANGNLMGLSVIPGVTSGEGCSIHGGCASCPYMKVVPFYRIS